MIVFEVLAFVSVNVKTIFLFWSTVKLPLLVKTWELFVIVVKSVKVFQSVICVVWTLKYTVHGSLNVSAIVYLCSYVCSPLVGSGLLPIDTPLVVALLSVGITLSVKVKLNVFFFHKLPLFIVTV